MSPVSQETKKSHHPNVVIEKKPFKGKTLHRIECHSRKILHPEAVAEKFLIHPVCELHANYTSMHEIKPSCLPPLCQIDFHCFALEAQRES